MARRDLYAFVQRPEFSSPARRKIGSRMNRDSPGSARLLRRIPSESGGAVLAVIINDDCGELTRIILCGGRAPSFRDGSGFIARRGDSDDARPACEALWLGFFLSPLSEG